MESMTHALLVFSPNQEVVSFFTRQLHNVGMTEKQRYVVSFSNHAKRSFMAVRGSFVSVQLSDADRVFVQEVVPVRTTTMSTNEMRIAEKRRNF
jgi:hypothetical protein